MKTLPLTTRIALRNMDKDSLEVLNCFHSSVILLGVVDNIWETSKKLETIQKTMIKTSEILSYRCTEEMKSCHIELENSIRYRSLAANEAVSHIEGRLSGSSASNFSHLLPMQ